MPREQEEVDDDSKTKDTDIEQEADFWAVWNAFQIALRDIHHDFNEWYWIKVLVSAILRQGIRKTPGWTNSCLRQVRLWTASLLPYIAMSLIIFVCYSYVCLRQILLGTDGAARVSIHDFMVLYFCIIILFHYTNSIFQSPGIVIVTSRLPESDSVGHEREGPGDILSNAIIPQVTLKGNGPSHLACNVIDSNITDTSSVPSGYFPSPRSSFCRKCNVTRPPRAHHCSTCKKCVLQMDHHCIWVNNCIGLHNYRSFFLAVTFLTLGCWYGILLCARPMYELWKQHMKVTTFTLSELGHFFNVPLSFRHNWSTLLQGQKVDPEVILKTVFTVMVGFSSFLTPLFCTHVHCVCSAQTTLERLMDMDRQKNMLLFKWKSTPHNSIETNQMNNQTDPLSHGSKRINPFDLGWKQNIKQMIGQPFYYVLLPVCTKTKSYSLQIKHKKVR